MRIIPFASQRNLHPFTLIIRLLLHMRAEGNRTHDPITKFLIDNRLVRIAVILHHLEQSIDQRLARRELYQLSAIGDGGDVGRLQRAEGNVEEDAQVLDVVLAGFRLAVEDSRDGHLVSAERFGDRLEVQPFDFLLRKEQRTVGGEFGDHFGLDCPLVPCWHAVDTETYV